MSRLADRLVTLIADDAAPAHTKAFAAIAAAGRVSALIADISPAMTSALVRAFIATAATLAPANITVVTHAPAAKPN